MLVLAAQTCPVDGVWRMCLKLQLALSRNRWRSRLEMTAEKRGISIASCAIAVGRDCSL